jgi:hypothetical protein
MSDEIENATPNGAPLDDETSTTQDLKAALSRARVDDLQKPDAESEALPSAAPLAEPAVETPESANEDAFAAAIVGASVATAPAPVPAVTPGMIQVPADHPMAQFYADTPEAPQFKGNRGAGILIALIAGLAYAVLFAGIIAALLAPSLTMTEFSSTIIEYLLSLAFLVPVGVFVIALIVLVLVANRSGWWAYVLGGFLVGVAVWAAAVLGLVLSPDLSGYSRQEGLTNLTTLMLFPLPILAGVAARETSVWFGAWIGARGRKIRAHNAAALDEYEAALAEIQDKTSATANAGTPLPNPGE